MIYFATTDESGRVLRVVGVADAAEADPNSIQLQTFSGWPEAPHEGAVPIVAQGVMAWRDERQLEEIKAQRWASIKAHRDTLDFAPYPHGAFEIDADASSRIDLMGAIMSMQITGMASRDWRCADNVMRTLTLAEIVGVGTGIAARRQVLIETSDALYKAIQAATTPEQVAAITWPTPP